MMSIVVTHLKLARWLIVFLLTLVSLALTVSISQGQTEAWSKPIRLSSQDTSSWFPDVVVDQTGRVHVVWSSGLEIGDEKSGRAYDTVMYTSSQQGLEWDKVIDIAGILQKNGSEATRPALFYEQSGTLHLTYRYTTVYYSRVPAQSSSNLDSWLARHQVSSNQVAYFSRLVADTKGALHLVYTENVQTPECEVCYHVFYRRSDDDGYSWSALTDISKLPTGAAKPQVLIDGQDNIHVVWEAGLGGSYGQLSGPSKVMYTASFDGGKSWTNPAEFIAPGGVAKNISIGLDGKGNILVAWMGLPESLVYFQFSRDQGRSWSSPKPIPGIAAGSVTPLDDYSMATDSAGSVHLVFVGRESNVKESFSNLFHTSWNGSTWSTPEAITNLRGDVPEWPRIAIGNGNQLHVVWFVRDKANVWKSDSGKYTVWYARGSSSAPTIAPIAWPTPTSTSTPKVVITPTPTPTAEISPTPTATLDPAVSGIIVPPEARGSIYTDHDEILLLAQSLIPTILVIGVVVVVVSRRRH